MTFTLSPRQHCVVEGRPTSGCTAPCGCRCPSARKAAMSDIPRRLELTFIYERSCIMPFPVDGSVSLEYGCTVSVSQVTASVVQVRRPPFMPAAASVRRYSRKQVHAREIPRRALCDSDQWVAATPFLSPVGSYSHDTTEPPPPQTPVLVALAAQSDAHTRLTHHTQLCRHGKITFGTKEVHQDTVVRHRRYDNCDISSGGGSKHSPSNTCAAVSKDSRLTIRNTWATEVM